jgi:hypothetical protein
VTLSVVTAGCVFATATTTPSTRDASVSAPGTTLHTSPTDIPVVAPPTDPADPTTAASTTSAEMPPSPPGAEDPQAVVATKAEQRQQTAAKTKQRQQRTHAKDTQADKPKKSKQRKKRSRPSGTQGADEPTYPPQDPTPVPVSGQTLDWQIGSTYVGTFADPDLTYWNGQWYAFATNTSHLKLPTLVSRNLTQWSPIKDGNGHRYDPLSRVGDWVSDRTGGSGLWAPAVEQMGDGWTVAYSAPAGTGAGGVRHNCIGLARSARPGGPYQHLGAPIECAPESPMGVIDPDLYVDAHGNNWMLWKFSGIAGKRRSAVHIRQLNDAGTGWAPGSVTTEILTHEGGWEGNTIENPSMVDFRGKTYLFYSAHNYRIVDYATGYAVCETPVGPCKRAPNNPFLTSATTGNLGPGGATAFVHRNTLHLAYHAWMPGKVGVLRRLHIASLLQNEDGTLSIAHPG